MKARSRDSSRLLQHKTWVGEGERGGWGREEGGGGWSRREGRMPIRRECVGYGLRDILLAHVTEQIQTLGSCIAMVRGNQHCPASWRERCEEEALFAIISAFTVHDNSVFWSTGNAPKACIGIAPFIHVNEAADRQMMGTLRGETRELRYTRNIMSVFREISHQYETHVKWSVCRRTTTTTSTAGPAGAASVVCVEGLLRAIPILGEIAVCNTLQIKVGLLKRD